MRGRNQSLYFQSGRVLALKYIGLFVLVFFLYQCSNSSGPDDDTIDLEYTIDFQITDESSNPLEAVSITIKDIQGTIIDVISTDDFGEASSILLDNNEYIFELSKDLFFPEADTSIAISGDYVLATTGGLIATPNFQENSNRYIFDITLFHINQLRATIEFMEEGMSPYPLTIELRNEDSDELYGRKEITENGSVTFDSVKYGNYRIYPTKQGFGFLDKTDFNFPDIEVPEPSIADGRSSQQISSDRRLVSANLQLYSQKNFFPGIEHGTAWEFRVNKFEAYEDVFFPVYRDTSFNSYWEFTDIQNENGLVIYSFVETLVRVGSGGEETNDIRVFDRNLIVTDSTFELNINVNRDYLFSDESWSMRKVFYGPENLEYVRQGTFSPYPELEVSESNWFDRISFLKCKFCDGDYYGVQYFRRY